MEDAADSGQDGGRLYHNLSGFLGHGDSCLSPGMVSPCHLPRAVFTKKGTPCWVALAPRTKLECLGLEEE